VTDRRLSDGEPDGPRLSASDWVVRENRPNDRDSRESAMTSMDWSKQAGEGPSSYQAFLVPGMFTPFAARLIADLEIKPGAAVLDVACGTGVVTRFAARATGATGTVTGVDIGAPMLAVARSQSVEPDSAPITYSEGNALDLPLADRSFDFATCHHGFQFFPDRTAAGRELHRVLRPGGRVAIACWTGLDETPVFRAIRDSLRLHVSEEAGQMMNSPFSVPAAALTALLEDVGFTAARVQRVELMASFPADPDFGARVIAAGPVAAHFDQSPAVAREAVAAAVTELAQQYSDGDNVSFPMYSNVATGVV
jgi:SAM-dependent methyltransferase